MPDTTTLDAIARDKPISAKRAKALVEELERAQRVIEAPQEWRGCGCTGVHWVDIDGEAEADPCDLWIELDDRLREYEAQEETKQ